MTAATANDHPMLAVRKTRAMAWLPSSPATLLLLDGIQNNNNSNNGDFQSHYFLSDDGVGCNDYEVSALMHMLSAHEDYFQQKKETESHSSSSWSALRSLSKAYRLALNECLRGWEQQVQLQQQQQKDRKEPDSKSGSITNGSTSNLDDKMSLELLQVAVPVMHLAEIFLLLPFSVASNATTATTPTTEHYQQNIMYIPGALTADTVRYLRLHHLADMYSVVLDDGDSDDDLDNIINELFQSTQPEQVKEGLPYWKLVKTMVLRGCLEDAWALLSRHSLCRACFDELSTSTTTNDNNDDEDDNSNDLGYHSASRTQDRQGFYTLRSLLLSAPLPGGRTSEYDVVWGERDDDDEEERQRLQSLYGDEKGSAVLLEGVPVSAYQLWEATKTTAAAGKPKPQWSSSQNKTASTSSSTVVVDDDFPISFQPHAAMKMHQHWIQYVRELQPLHLLKRRVPQLHSILSILSGDLSRVVCDNWAEALCAELLYVRPDIVPCDIRARAAHWMTQYAATSTTTTSSSSSHDESDPSSTTTFTNPFNHVVLSIMDGNAGRAIRTMQDLGGAYGAALPATMTALLCSLLREANVLPTNELETASLQTELLLAASFAILSALALTSKADIGVRLSTRLLLPYCKPSNDNEDSENCLRLVATLAETLQRHIPTSDAQVRELLDLCHVLLQQKSVRALDGCVHLCLCRYRQYLADHRPGGAMHWLLQGLQLEWLVVGSTTSGSGNEDDDGEDASGNGEDDGNGNKNNSNHNNASSSSSSSKWERLAASSICYRTLVTWCLTTSQCLLNQLVGDTTTATSTNTTASMFQDDDLIFEAAGEMVASILQQQQANHEDNNDNAIAHHHVSFETIPEVVLLKTMYDMANAFFITTDKQQQPQQNLVVVARKIVDCLQERAAVNDNDDDDDDGIVAPLAHSSMHWNLLRLAMIILQHDEQKQDLLMVLEEEQKHWMSSSSLSSFDVHGMQILLTRLTLVAVSQSDGGGDAAGVGAAGAASDSSGGGEDNNTSKILHEMRLTFGKGLVRAIVFENKQRRGKPKRNHDDDLPYQRNQGRGVHTTTSSVHLSKLSLADQEKVVAIMLDY